jgi:hypothetical protein
MEAAAPDRLARVLRQPRTVDDVNDEGGMMNDE